MVAIALFIKDVGDNSFKVWTQIRLEKGTLYGKNEFPGGKIEAGETPEECVIREILEESGLSIHNPKLCGLLMFPSFKGNDWYVFVFTATEFISGELIDSPEGNLEWIPDEKVLDLPLWESDQIFMTGIRCVDIR